MQHKLAHTRTDFKLTPLAVKLEGRREVNIEWVIKEKAVAAAREAGVGPVINLHACLIGDRGVDFSRHAVVVSIKKMAAGGLAMSHDALVDFTGNHGAL